VTASAPSGAAGGFVTLEEHERAYLFASRRMGQVLREPALWGRT